MHPSHPSGVPTSADVDSSLIIAQAGNGRIGQLADSEIGQVDESEAYDSMMVKGETQDAMPTIGNGNSTEA